MTTPEPAASDVEVRPEVVFLYELLQELTRGRLRIPRFQRPFVWRRDQMTDLLDSVYKQYPIGSVLVWETDYPVATLEHLGPFSFPKDSKGPVGYLLDGHQRLSTLAGALVSRDDAVTRPSDGNMWNMGWNLQNKRFQHIPERGGTEGSIFPLTALLDTFKFLAAVDAMRNAVGSSQRNVNDYVADVTSLARAFQHYRVPVIRIRQTGLSEAVEIFARLNSKGQAMTADQMVSALMFRQPIPGETFDLASEIDNLAERLAERYFGDVDRTAVLRAILANLDEDIYKTDWTRLAKDRREEILRRMRDGVERTRSSLELAVNFLNEIGVMTSRLLPYGMQLVLLSAFFDRQNDPSPAQIDVLKRWFWASSFSAWFGGANTSRITALVYEFRHNLAASRDVDRLANFDLEAEALPFPSVFDMRSARARALLLVMLRQQKLSSTPDSYERTWHDVAERGPSAIGRIFSNPPKDLVGNPANRAFIPPGLKTGVLRSWLEERAQARAWDELAPYSIDQGCAELLLSGDISAFIAARQSILIEQEHAMQVSMGIMPSHIRAANAPVDTD